MHIHLLISIGLLLFLFIVLWRYVVGTSSITLLRISLYCGLRTDSLLRFFTISFQPREIGFVVRWETGEQSMDEHHDEQRNLNMEVHEGIERSQNGAGNQNREEYQDREEDDNLVEVAPRILAPLPETRFSPHTPVLSSVLKAQCTPKPSVWKTTADNLRPFRPGILPVQGTNARIPRRLLPRLCRC